MKGGVSIFKQTTDFTCGACATLMVWRHLDNNVPLSKQNEFLIWTDIMGLPFKFSSPYRIAEFFIKKGFEAKLIMKQENVSEDIMALECCRVEPAERKLFLDFFQAYDRIMRNRVASATLDKKPTISDIRKALSNHDHIIVLVDSYYTVADKKPRTQQHQPHWIVVTGCDNKGFHANDPAQGKITLGKRALKKAMDTHPNFGWPSTLIMVKSKLARA